jgi:hypothetical protein
MSLQAPLALKNAQPFQVNGIEKIDAKALVQSPSVTSLNYPNALPGSNKLF